MSNEVNTTERAIDVRLYALMDLLLNGDRAYWELDAADYEGEIVADDAA